MPVVRAAIIGVALAWLWSCASEVVRQPQSLSAVAGAQSEWIELMEDAQLSSMEVYARTLPAGSVWELRGTVPQGKVYRRVNGIFTIEGAHVHEAYLVLADEQLVGFYLPVERAYSPTPPLALKIRQRRKP